MSAIPLSAFPVPLWLSVADLRQGAACLARRRYGVIEARDGAFWRVTLRPWPKIVSRVGVAFGQMMHRRTAGDWCRLYYNQPLFHSNYLAVTYVVAGGQGSLASLYRALEVLDHIARLKRTDALLCDVANSRISSRLLARRGWTAHCPARWQRNYIKRFYGDYPPQPVWLM